MSDPRTEVTHPSSLLTFQEGKMKQIFRKTFALIVLSASTILMAGCGAGDALGGLGKGLGNLFKGFKLP